MAQIDQIHEPENDPRVRRAVLWARLALATAAVWPAAFFAAAYHPISGQSGLIARLPAAAIVLMLIAHVAATNLVFRRHLTKLGFTGGLDRALWPMRDPFEFDERSPIQLPAGEQPALNEKGRARMGRVLRKA